MSVIGKKVSDYKLLLAEWDYAKNKNLDPKAITAGSNIKVWWRCRNGHEFFQSPNGRTNNQREKGGVGKCSQCRGKKWWTWERIIRTARAIVKKEGYLPPAEHVRKMGKEMMVWGVYENGKTWDDLRGQLGAFHSSSFVQSRCGLRWRSHPEASLSNFLFARGISHGKGRKYPKGYSKSSGKRYGYFDLYFVGEDGKTYDVEIWGDKPHGHNEKNYAEVRRAKEEFNRNNSGFLGINFRDCYSDVSLGGILFEYIGNPAIVRKTQPYDELIETTHWSNAEELIESCRKLAERQASGKFPTEEWLRKRGKWANRKGPAYNTMAIYIKNWIGGVRKLRLILGQEENSTVQWSRERSLVELKQWYNRYGRSPGAILAAARRKQIVIPRKDIKHAGNLNAAVAKHAGGMIQACLDIGIRPSRTKKEGKKLLCT